MFGLGRRKTVETMLAELAAVGLNLREGVELEQVFANFDRRALEKDGFPLLLAVMGDEQLDPKTFRSLGWLSDDVWHFDTEAIEDHGSYTRIVESCLRLAGTDLKIDDIQDFVDVEAGVAWVEATVSGQRRRVDLKIDNDWVDPMIFGRVQDWLNESGTGRRFFSSDLGQDVLLVCRQADEIQKISRATGLRFTNLNM